MISLGIWQDSERLDGPAHMARDEALLNEAEAPVLRIYRWPSRQVSLGYFCSLREARVQYPGWPMVRRWTGGGVVEHGEDWTFSLAIPGARPPAGALYCEIHRALTEALRESGVNAVLRESNEPARPGGACFLNPVESDVMVEAVKIAGGAQRRNRRGVLHQGSLRVAGVDSDFFERFGANLAPTTQPWTPSPAYLQAAGRLEQTRYATAEWLEKFK
ncbi:MAG TPA: hypothetical protein VIS74_07675 [Chthoniobacterales bacterium]